MRRRRIGRSGPALVTLCLLGCATSYDELPLCQPIGRADRAPLECRQSDEATAYHQLLAWEILRRSQWEFPYAVPLHVEVDAAGRVGRVCVGSADDEAGWSTRDRVAASLPWLRSLPAAPACLAGSTIRLNGALAEQGLPAGGRPAPLGLSRCEDPPDRNRRCPPEQRAVCGIFRDGRRINYRNACEACRERRVIGYYDFVCG